MNELKQNEKVTAVENIARAISDAAEKYLNRELTGEGFISLLTFTTHQLSEYHKTENAAASTGEQDPTANVFSAGRENPNTKNADVNNPDDDDNKPRFCAHCDKCHCDRHEHKEEHPRSLFIVVF